jgi:GDP-L-fucose synthase
MMDKQSRIFVAGHRGPLGSALMRTLETRGYRDPITRTHKELDLADAEGVQALFRQERPEYVFMAAAKVGGIQANSALPAEFIQTNLAIQTSVIHAAHLASVERLVFFGSNCTYPKDALQPMREEYLSTGPLEPTSESYAVAKIAGMKMCQAYNQQYGSLFIPVIPATLYGPNDDFDSNTSHVLTALLDRYHKAKESGGQEVVLWGTGEPRREFLYVNDMADACIYLMDLDADTMRSVLGLPGGVVNIGSGLDVSIRELADIIGRVVGFQGQTENDTGRPDGAPRKLLDSSRMNGLGWSSTVPLEDGIKKTYEWYLNTEFAGTIEKRLVS